MSFARELLVLRHGSAERGFGMSDSARKLTSDGKRDIQRIGVAIQERGWQPERTVCSPAVRARVTANKALKAGGMTTRSVSKDPRIYGADVADLLAVLADHAEAPGRLLLVGHNPGLEDLVSFLAGIRVSMAPGDLARLAMPDDWRAVFDGCGELLDRVQPGALPRDFPFPQPGSSERRPRPAYYYSQSSVVPFRRTAAGIEILIIGSSKRKHWLVPKGICEPNLTPQRSAAKEAKEEAGIRGVVAKAPLGEYTYRKWGGECTCAVYSMEVTHVIPESEWRERHRGREWVTPEVAAQRLKAGPLRDIAARIEALLRTADSDDEA